MGDNKKAQWLFFILLVFLATPAHAEFYKKSEGSKFYAGLSAGGFYLDVDNGGSSDGGSLGFLAGFEEEGWAFEGKWFKLRTTDQWCTGCHYRLMTISNSRLASSGIQRMMRVARSQSLV